MRSTCVRPWGSRLALLALSALAGGMMTASPAAAEQVTMDYFFEAPQTVPVIIDGQVYDRIVMRGCPNSGAVGHPALPARGAQILLPFGAEVESVRIETGEPVMLPGRYRIEPVGQPVRLSDDPGAVAPPAPDPAVYSLNTAVPSSMFETAGVHAFRGYGIAILKLQPVQYVPATGKLSWFPRLTVKVNTAPTGRAGALYRGLEQDRLEVMRKVDNPWMANTYVTNGRLGGKGYDLLILTTDALAPSFQPLKNYHDAHSIATEIHTTTDVGSNDPIDVRDYIRQRYENDGIEYVIIGGDDDVIPAKDLYVDGESTMPGDIFFSCLDGSWNWDGDGRWGEPNDGEGGGDVDLVAEVYVGRACAGNTTEADRFVTKTLWYLENNHSTPENVLLVGEYLGFGGVAEWGGNYLDELIDGSSAHGYTTIGIPSDRYTIDTLYERDGNWSKTDLLNRLDAGIHILNHLGHGSPDYAMKLYNSDILNSVQNEDLCFVYSQTCLAGHLDDFDCWAEHMNIKIDEGAFAVIMNARYGYGALNSTDGPSQRYDREFWDAVFSEAEGFPEIGKANSDSKEDNIYRINDSCMRWCCYELNLFGDPSVSFIGAMPALTVKLPEGCPEYIDPGVPTVIPVEIVSRDEQYVEGSGLLHYRFDGGSYQTSQLVHVEGDMYEATLPGAACDDVPEYYFSAEGDGGTVVCSPYNAPDSVYSSKVGHPVVIMADDFETDQGWTVYAGADTGNWERADPQEVSSGGTITQPGDDHTPDGTLCFVTGPLAGNSAGDYDVDGGPTHLTSPPLELEGLDAEISYWRWYHISTEWNDELVIEVSNDDGANWTTVESIDDRQTWTYVKWYVSDFVTPTNQVRVRFTADDSPNDSLVEALIDDFAVSVLECEESECPEDINGDGVVDTEDLLILLGNWGNAGDGDVDGDGVVGTADLLMLLAAWGECP
jgi:hypothetical protein